jgi:hypothetical protein
LGFLSAAAAGEAVTMAAHTRATTANPANHRFLSRFPFNPINPSSSIVAEKSPAQRQLFRPSLRDMLYLIRCIITWYGFDPNKNSTRTVRFPG